MDNKWTHVLEDKLKLTLKQNKELFNFSNKMIAQYQENYVKNALKDITKKINITDESSFINYVFKIDPYVFDLDTYTYYIEPGVNCLCGVSKGEINLPTISGKVEDVIKEILNYDK